MKFALDTSKVHGDVIGKIDDLRNALRFLAKATESRITLNRMYLHDTEISFHFTVTRRGSFLVCADDTGFEMRQRVQRKSASQIVKHRVSLEEIENGSFMEKFK